MGKIMNPREEAIMNELWESSTSISTKDLKTHLSSMGWNKSSFYTAVQSLFEKEYVKFSGLERSNTHYARILEPAISREEYWAIFLKEKGIGIDSLKKIYQITAQGSAEELPE